MEASKKLVLAYKKADGTTYNVTISNPQDELETETIQTALENFLAAGAVSVASIYDAYYNERTIQEIELA